LGKTIKVRNDNIEAALKVFKRESKEIVEEQKKRSRYRKPSEVRREKINKAKRRNKRNKQKNYKSEDSKNDGNF